MPRSMADPNYRYSPWTPERRKAASEAAKRRWAERKARETAEYEARKSGALGQLGKIRRGKKAEMEEIAAKWHRLKAEVEQIDAAMEHLNQASPILQRYGLDDRPLRTG